jgi:hypothetical protein
MEIRMIKLLKILFLFFIFSTSVYSTPNEFNISGQVWKRLTLDVISRLIMPDIYENHSTFPISSNDPPDFPLGIHGYPARVDIWGGTPNAYAMIVIPASVLVTNYANMYFPSVLINLSVNSNICQLDGSGMCTFYVDGSITTGPFAAGIYVGDSDVVVAVYFI